MKTMIKLAFSGALLLAASGLQAGDPRDCLLEGTVRHTDRNGDSGVMVQFHSMEKFNDDANCRVRRNEKLEFKLPDDPRLEEAPEGSSVKYRYRRNRQGESEAELISIGTST